MQKLGDFVIETADNCEDVRTWLRTHTDYRTPKLIPEINSDESDETELTNEKQTVEENDRKRRMICSKYPTELLNRMKQLNVSVTVTPVDRGAYSLWVEP